MRTGCGFCRPLITVWLLGFADETQFGHTGILRIGLLSHSAIKEAQLNAGLFYLLPTAD
jgi:hypothetical protein